MSWLDEPGIRLASTHHEPGATRRAGHRTPKRRGFGILLGALFVPDRLHLDLVYLDPRRLDAPPLGGERKNLVDEDLGVELFTTALGTLGHNTPFAS